MLRSIAHGRYLLLLALVSALAFVPLVSPHEIGQQHARSIARRDGISIPLFPTFSAPESAGGKSSDTSTTSTSSHPPSTTSEAASKTTDASTTQSTQASTSSASSSPSTSSSTPSTSQTSAATSSTTSAEPSSTSNAPTPTPSSSSEQHSSVVSTALTTNQAGSVVTTILTVAASESAPSSSSSAPAGQSSGGSSSSGISTGGIIGLSVAGGVLLLSVVAFAIFKFSRKRYLDEYDDGDAIKWPELNTHGESPHALPTHRTGGGFETSSEVNLTRPDSRAGSIAPSATASAVDLYSSQHDPYAVPPLPHLNPNVGGATPYRDDPSATYYDAYSGPVPHTLQGEAIPMTQIGGRARSPMPGGPGMGMETGRMSPAPGAGLAPPMGMGRSVSPVPGAAYGPGNYGA